MSKGGESARTTARLAAVQALYQVDMTGIDVETAVNEFEHYRLPAPFEDISLERADRDHFRRLVSGIAGDQEDLDNMLSAVLAEGWPIERLDRILRLILRGGAFEIADCHEIPARTAIVEYVRLAEDFYAGKEPSMVNGVLDKIAHSLRPEEFEAAAPETPGSGA